MVYEHPNTTPETESDEIIKSGVEELVTILNENEVTSKDKKDDGGAFEDIEYVEASLPDQEIVSLEEENVVHQEEKNVVYQEEEEVDLEDISQIQDVVLREKLFSINRLIDNIESLNDNPTLDFVLNSSVSFPILEESNNSFSDNFSPEFETFCDHTKETRSEADLFLASDNSIPPGIENFSYDSKGNIRFLEALLIDDSIIFPVNEVSDFDNSSIPRPPLEPPDAKPDSGEEISVVRNTIDELECLNPRDEFDVSNDDYSTFMFVIYSKMFLSFLFAKSEDTIFNPGFTPHRLKFLVFGYLSRSARASHPFFKISLEKSISLINIA
nr:hypothetical protein [Tanacetum cinerariifolium]